MNDVASTQNSSCLHDDLLPVVTVIMPVRNEGPFIVRSLGAVLAQDYPGDRLEVIVADGMSTDETRKIVGFIQKEDPRVSLIENLGRIVPKAINAALRLAKGEVIVRVDGHTIVDRNYVRECVSALQRTGADNVGGRMSAIGSTNFAQAVALATSSRFGVGGARFHYSIREEWVDTVYMGAWPREVFDRIGGFDEELVRNQDDEFNYRLLSRGGRILLSPQIESSYYNRSTCGALWRQYYQYGYWKIRVMQKHFEQMRIRQFVPALFVSGLLVALLLAFLWPVGKLVLGTLVLTYVLANLAASITAARQRQLRLAPLVFVAFSTIHLSYGLGFWHGFFKFRKRWTDKTMTARHDEASNPDQRVERSEAHRVQTNVRIEQAGVRGFCPDERGR